MIELCDFRGIRYFVGNFDLRPSANEFDDFLAKASRGVSLAAEHGKVVRNPWAQ